VKPVQSRLEEFENPHIRDLSALSDGERNVYEAVEIEGYGPRELARKTGRSPGTIGNLLRRARRKLEEDGGQA
jgi:DNA-directed RNA polymerase specialized sigma24 family protein